MRRNRWKQVRQSIALLAVLLVIINGLTVFGAGFGASDNSENNTQNTSEELAEDTGSEIVSALSVNELAENTIISSDEATGIAQLDNIIPDSNFRTEVYRSLYVAGQLGNPEDPEYAGLEGDELYRAVLQNFTGTVYASGYVKRMEYGYTFRYKQSETSSWRTVTYPSSDDDKPYTSREEAIANMESDISFYRNGGAIIDESSPEIIASVSVTSEKKPDDQLITAIQGIEWLRHAEEIDISSNAITSLMPLDLERLDDLIKQTGASTGVTGDGQTWFGDPVGYKDTLINFYDNPIRFFPTMTGGALLALGDGEDTQGFSYGYDEMVFFEEPQQSINIPVPEVLRGNVPIEWGNFTILENSIPDSKITVSSGNDTILVDNITGSGEFQIGFGNVSDSVAMPAYEDKLIKVNNIGLTVRVNQRIRVLHEVTPVTPSVTINFEKTVTGGSGTVPGAVYQLFLEDGTPYSYKDEEGNTCYVKGETDKNGNFTMSVILESGTYYLQEITAPPGYELSNEKLSFTIGAVTICGGYQKDGIIYVDRYSDPIKLSLSQTPAGASLAQVNVIYFDEENNSIPKTATFDTLQKAEDFINIAKGSETEPGILRGVAQVQPVFTVGSSASDEQETTPFSFVKYGEDGNDGSIKPLPGAVFTLTCLHQHAENEEYCSDLHIQKDPALSGEDGCLWTASSESDAEGKVSFENLVIGEYRLEETEVPDGYIKPEKTWTVTVSENPNAGEGDDSLVISVTEDGSSEPGIHSGDFRIINPNKVPFSFMKIDGDTAGGDHPTGLGGAEFQLFYAEEAGDDWQKGELVATATSSEDPSGLVDFGKIAAGTYILEETKAPPGFTKPSGYWIVTISIKNGESTISFEGVDVPGYDGSHNAIANYRIGNLPTMGGKGTFIFAAGGVLLMGCAIILFLKLKRSGRVRL